MSVLSTQSARHWFHRAGFTLTDLLAVLSLLVLLAGVVGLVLKQTRGVARQMQNNTQLRAIHQGMMTFSNRSTTGGGDGYFPGLSSRGKALTTYNPHNLIVGGMGRNTTFGNNNDILGYAADADNVSLSEMNDPATGTGFLQYAFAELLTGDWIPYGGPGYFINPADSIKIEFVPGDPGQAGTFDMTKVSYTTLNVAVDDFVPEWNDTSHRDLAHYSPRAIDLADRAIGDGNSLGQPGSTASSVWTEPGSGHWRGSVARHDSSVEIIDSHALPSASLAYGNLKFEDNGGIDNLFAHPDGESLNRNAAGEIERDQGVLFDQDEQGQPGGV